MLPCWMEDLSSCRTSATHVMCEVQCRCARLLSRQMVPAVSGNSRNLHPANKNAAFFLRWSTYIFAFEKASDQHPDKLASSYSGMENCFNAFQLFPQISDATAGVMWGWFCLILLAMCEQSLFWQALLDVSSQFPVRLPGLLPKTQWYVRHSDLANLWLGWMSNVEKGCSSHTWICLKKCTLNRNVSVLVSFFRLLPEQIFLAAAELSDTMGIPWTEEFISAKYRHVAPDSVTLNLTPSVFF